MIKFILFAYLGVFNAMSEKLPADFEQDSLKDTIHIKGKISKTQTLRRDWNGGGKNYGIFWVEIDLEIDADFLKKELQEAEIEYNKTLSPKIIFVSGSTGITEDLRKYSRFKADSTVILEVEKIFFQQYLRSESRKVLFKNISPF